MRKYFPFISFILILSFVLPFFPCFSVLTKAEDSVSSDDAYIKWEKDNVDAIRNGLADNGLVVNNDYYDNGYYYVDPDDSLWKDILIQWGLDGTDYGKPLSRVVYDYAVQNDISNTQIYNDCFNNIYNNLLGKSSYYLYEFISVDELFNKYDFSNYLTYGYNLALFKSALSGLCSDSDSYYFLSCYNGMFQGDLYSVSADFISNNYLYLYTGSFYSYPELPFQIYQTRDIYDSFPSLDGRLKFSDGLSSVSFNAVHYKFYVNSSGNYDHYDRLFDSVSDVSFFVGGAIQPFNRIAFTSTVGEFFISSGDSFSVPVFRSSNLISDFLNGNSYVYQFDPSIDINKYGSDLDLSELYDVIRDTVADSESDIIDSINRVANNYLKDQVELLGDIKNALNDSFGRSWLRLIHDQLDDYFPKTLDALDDLATAISNLSFSGGGSSVDLSSTNTILSDIYDRIGLMLGPYNGDGFTQNTLNHITNELAGKMPFCVVTDVVVIGALFSHEPVHPDFQFPVPFQPGETFEIDISFWEYARPFINAFFIILFIIGLIVLTQKIFNSLKG